ncbi:MAG: extracellular solute-binding protein [Chloroflexi bacterium]|nr:extracellular solute-binding protein [Chloroflexota bacterium]
MKNIISWPYIKDIQEVLKRGAVILISLILIASFTACTPSATPPAVPETGLETEAATAESGWSKEYEGTTLNFIAEATLNTTILKELLPDFTEKTGIIVNVEEAPYDSLVQKVVLDFSTHKGGYDIISMPYEYLGSFAENGYIMPLDEELSKDAAPVPDFSTDDLIPSLWEASTKWKDKIYGMPSNSAVMMMFYRKDLMENEQEKAAFQEKYGYPLAPATTWQQYRDIAEFFTRKAGDTLAGETLTQDFYGVSLAGKRHIATVLEWFNYAWTYGGGLFDSSGQLQVNSDANIKSLEYWLELTAFAPPGYTSATWDEVTAALQQGTAAQAITWADTAGSMEDTNASKVKGKIGYASIPTLKEGDKKVAHLGSWIYAISVDTQNKDAAMLMMKWALSKSIQLQLSQKGGLPATISAFSDEELNEKLPYWKQTMVSLEESRIRPRIPQWGQISDILSEQLSRVMVKEVSPADALSEAQKQLQEALKDALPVTAE